MLTRRQAIATGVAAGTALLVPFVTRWSRAGVEAATVPGGTLDPTTLPKYVTPLFVMPAMPRAGTIGAATDSYTIAARQFRQQILPAGRPPTTVFGYGSTTDPGTFHYPAYTIEAQVNRPVRVLWANQLVDGRGRFLPHLFAVDPTIHWANPGGGPAGRDSRPEFTSTPGPYRGPVPLVTHLHGSHVFDDSDGYPEAWYLPAASDIPRGFARVGSFYDQFAQRFRDRTGVGWDRGTAVFQYSNDQRATALWYHSHELGLTRLNIYAGLTGMYLLRGGPADLPGAVLPGPAPRPGDPPGTRYYEIPLVVQDRSFNNDGSLFFPNSRAFFGDVPAGGPFIPDSDIPPIWNPEFFGNTIVVNGRTWPVLAVEPRRYRFRLLNASNTRVYMFKIVTNPTAARPVPPALPFWLIGTDGGFLPAPVALSRLVSAVAERNDVIVDFSGLRPGTELFLVNEGPDEPFGGGEPTVDFEPADPATTGQVMKFVVTAPASTDTSVPPSALRLPGFNRLGPAANTRRLSLNEMASTLVDAPIMGMLGTLNADLTPHPLGWGDPVTEQPRRGSTEVWELWNFTEDAHPIHLHQVQFQVINRQPFLGQPRPPEPGEVGDKDTILAFPDEITRVTARFDIAGRYVWHCHIIDHEDNEMMRPYIVS
jgi:bilirubin oxidase